MYKHITKFALIKPFKIKTMNLPDYLSFGFPLALFVLYLAYLHYKFKIKTWKHLFKAFIGGTLAIVLVIIAHELTKINDWYYYNYTSLRKIVFYIFIVIAFCAELGKFIILRYLFYHEKSFNSPFSGILYGIAISIGFSFTAIIIYATGVIGFEKIKYLTLFLWTYPLANIVFGTIQGFFLGMGKIRQSTIIDEATALGIATFFHALFYFCFLTSNKQLFFIPIIGSIFIIFILLEKAISLQPEIKKR
ncbi:PrsW family intramembrane metalloprotease [Candidatus Sulfidibacterium hydrothermale]|uniref:PrsW family glutamic-type intramembrane protease n=1 Tax=Candidatus Sulfidibacterium hydrothermale TaxID=2875962 RepID=UPI001F0B26FC|nr:PrsW family glutamic-type intramembrane protease [Candidatus Sulfidibacterium hydrothermale]UBM62601.1 PrsW family intramembrane metalloprotease [Candidatus Sulfidibacterium hydrothermale]